MSLKIHVLENWLLLTAHTASLLTTVAVDVKLQGEESVNLAGSFSNHEPHAPITFEIKTFFYFRILHLKIRRSALHIHGQSFIYLFIYLFPRMISILYHSFLQMLPRNKKGVPSRSTKERKRNNRAF